MQLVTFLTRICSTVSNGHKPSPFKPIYPSLSCDKYVSAQKNLLCTCCCIHIHIHLKFPLQFLIVLRVHFLLSVWLLPPIVRLNFHNFSQFPHCLTPSLHSLVARTALAAPPTYCQNPVVAVPIGSSCCEQRPSALGPFHPTHSNNRSP